MTPKKTRIAVNDKKIADSLKGIHSGTEIVIAEDLDSMIGQVDFFLLDDNTAIRFLGVRAEESWPSVVVAVADGQKVPASYSQGIVDDLLVIPARALDVERIIRNHEYVQSLRNLEESSRGVAGLVKQLQEDISLAQKIQRRLIREKFPALGPLAVKSKYWCGLKSGGDYFDLFEFPGGTHAGLIVSDSSSYALSTSLIGSLMQFSLHVGRDELDNPQKIVQTLFAKIREGMKEKDKLSLLYGVLDRKTYSLKLVNCGGIYLAKKSSKDGKISWGSKGENAPLSLSEPTVPEGREFSLEPGDRMLVCSDGWGEALSDSMASLMERFLSRDTDPQEMLNEMSFQLRRKLEKEADEPAEAEGEFPMPPQDCSALVFDLAPNVLRLAK